MFLWSIFIYFESDNIYEWIPSNIYCTYWFNILCRSYQSLRRLFLSIEEPASYWSLFMFLVCCCIPPRALVPEVGIMYFFCCDDSYYYCWLIIPPPFPPGTPIFIIIFCWANCYYCNYCCCCTDIICYCCICWFIWFFFCSYCIRIICCSLVSCCPP
jgi:hypothetical protein